MQVRCRHISNTACGCKTKERLYEQYSESSRSGTLTSIYIPYSTGSGEYYFDNMTNPYPQNTYQNTVVGIPTSGGTYYTLWNTSQGTY
ncbi:MAG: hypothetical protein KGI27_09375 [Thaumarchaeota archaeon]|nr:hypothetical protein [Nitrososphaerota archaeon]